MYRLLLTHIRVGTYLLAYLVDRFNSPPRTRLILLFLGPQTWYLRSILHVFVGTYIIFLKVTFY